MNKWKEVAELFGLELEEKFRYICAYCKSSCLYKFTDNGIEFKEKGGEWHFSQFVSSDILTKLINGTYEVVKLPWKPKYGNTYYSVYKDGDTLRVTDDTWVDDVIDFQALKLGLVFKTEKEAEEKGISIMKKIIEEYENE